MKRKTTWNLLCFQTSPSCAIEMFLPLFVCWRVRGYFFGGNLKGIFEALIWSFHTNTSKVVSSLYDKVPFFRRFACQMLMLLLAEQSFSCLFIYALFLSFSVFRSTGCLVLLWLVVRLRAVRVLTSSRWMQCIVWRQDLKKVWEMGN